MINYDRYNSTQYGIFKPLTFPNRFYLFSKEPMVQHMCSDVHKLVVIIKQPDQFQPWVAHATNNFVWS